MKNLVTILLLAFSACCVQAQTPTFNGLTTDLGNLSRLSSAKTRSISPENFSGAKGNGGMADPVKDAGKRNVANAAAKAEMVGWKVNPYVIIAKGETLTIAEMEGPGAIQHILMTPTGNWRQAILRFYWDNEKEPSVEVPVGDFFCMGWNEFAALNSLPVTVNPGSAFNCYWKMPFRKKCRITVENLDTNTDMRLYYSVDYALGDIGKDEAYFHAQYRRSNTTQGAMHTIIDGVKGRGQYVGTYMAVRVNNDGWWGEGELKFYLDGDKDFATIVGTGTKDYFGGSYNFENKKTKKYQTYTTPYTGLVQVINPDSIYVPQQKFGMYRWHITDPIRFERDLKVTIQDLGMRRGKPYLHQASDIATVAFWYQAEPHQNLLSCPQQTS
jgi:hypothetical protein